MAGSAVMNKVHKLRIPSTNEAIASPLVLATAGGAVAEILGSSQLHALHTWALSGFSLPHLGQYILILLSTEVSLFHWFLVSYLRLICYRDTLTRGSLH
jgi:hypothetical protein